MATFKVPYFIVRHGRGDKKRYYWQPSTSLAGAGWKTERLPDDLEKALARARQLNEDLAKWYAGTAEQSLQEKHGSLAAVVASYKRSWKYKELAAKTRESYDYALRILLKWSGDAPVSSISPRLVEKFYTTLRTSAPAKAALCVRVLRIILAFARKEGLVANAASRPGIRHTAAKGTLWTPEAVRAIAAVADAEGHFSIGTALVLNEWLGQRKGDIISMLKTAYKNGCLYKKQSKRGAEVHLPVDDVPGLKARLLAQLAHNAGMAVRTALLFPSPDGDAYSERNFAELVERFRNKAAEQLQEQGVVPAAEHPLYNIDKLIFKDLRHTAVTRMAEAGATIPQIAAITGHSFRTCEEIIDRYNIRTKRMAGEAFRLRLAAE